MSYLRYLRLLVYSGVQHILCCVFVVLCTLCFQFLWIVYFFYCPSVFSNVYLSCILCTLCCQFLWIVIFLLPLRYSLTFICPVSCVPYVSSFSGLSIFFIVPSVFSNVYLSCFLCTLCCQFLWIVYLFIAPSVFSNVYLSCVLCTLCCQFLWIVYFFLLPFGIL